MPSKKFECPWNSFEWDYCCIQMGCTKPSLSGLLSKIYSNEFCFHSNESPTLLKTLSTHSNILLFIRITRPSFKSISSIRIWLCLFDLFLLFKKNCYLLVFDVFILLSIVALLIRLQQFQYLKKKISFCLILFVWLSVCVIKTFECKFLFVCFCFYLCFCLCYILKRKKMIFILF